MMDPKLKLLAEKLKDERSKKVVFVAHCILNENTRYLGGAFRKGCIDEVVDEMQRQGIGIVQMKCPEQKAWGGLLKKYMWQPMGSRNTILYKLKGVFLPFFIWNTRRIYQKIAREIGAEIKDYLESGFEVLGIMGIAGSPSCGVTRALDIRKSFEFLANTDTDDLNRKRMNELGVNELIIEGKGFFIEAIEKDLKKKNINVRFYEHDLSSEIKGEATKVELSRG
jgi:predicted secreted protein